MVERICATKVGAGRALHPRNVVAADELDERVHIVEVPGEVVAWTAVHQIAHTVGGHEQQIITGAEMEPVTPNYLELLENLARASRPKMMSLRRPP